MFSYKINKLAIAIFLIFICMGTLNTIGKVAETPDQKENPLIAKIKSIGKKFFDTLQGYTELDEKYIESFFFQGSNKNTINDFFDTCSHREFYAFIEGSPGLRKVFLLKFKERLKYPALNKNTNNYVGEFQIKKASGAGATTDRFKITTEDMIYYMTQIKLFKIKE